MYNVKVENEKKIISMQLRLKSNLCGAENSSLK